MPPNTPPTPNADRIAFVARASLICPFLVVLLALAGSRMESPFRWMAEVGAFAFAFVGLICGITALVRGRQSGGASVAVQGGVGFLISLVFLGIVLNNYLQSQSSSARRDSASAEAQRLSEALAQFVARTTELEQRLVAASKPLAESPVLNLTAVQSPADLDSRKRQVHAFMDASRALSNHLAQAQTTIETQLTERGVAADEAREISSGFLNNLQPKISILNQIRQIEHHYGGTLTSALDLLNAQWGNWKCNTDGAPQFANESQAQRYSECLERLKTLESQDLQLKHALAGSDPPSPSP
jgi:hypothetical protein